MVPCAPRLRRIQAVGSWTTRASFAARTKLSAALDDRRSGKWQRVARRRLALQAGQAVMVIRAHSSGSSADPDQAAFPERRERTTARTRSAASSAVSCSQILTTSHPCSRRRASFSRSRARLRASFGRQQYRRTRGVSRSCGRGRLIADRAFNGSTGASGSTGSLTAKAICSVEDSRRGPRPASVAARGRSSTAARRLTRLPRIRPGPPARRPRSGCRGPAAGRRSRARRSAGRRRGARPWCARGRP